MKNRKSIIFIISFAFAGVFCMSPFIMRISFIKSAAAWFLAPLVESGYKSSYVETIGGIIGTVLAITGTLFLQGMIDKKADEEKRLKEENDVRYRIIVIYYDLKLALQNISKIYNLLIAAAFLVDKNKTEEFYNSASKIELYIDNNWIRNVASLHEVFDEKTLEKIFLIYGDISSIRSGLRSGDTRIYQTSRLISLICKFFSGIHEGEPQLVSEYKELLDVLREKGKIENKCF